MTTELTFPVLWQGTREYKTTLEREGCPRTVPWDFVAEHESMCKQNHDQTTQRLAERGGLSPEEMVAVVEHHSLKTVRDRTWWMSPSESVPRLKALLDKWERARAAT